MMSVSGSTIGNMKLFIALASFVAVSALSMTPSRLLKQNSPLKMVLGDAMAQIGIAAALNTQSASPAFLSRSFPIAKTEVKQGMFKEYTVDIPENEKQAWGYQQDDARSTFKTAEQTDQGKNKYWAIFAVLLFGSFVVPMAQYYWYVADEDDFGEE